MIICTNCGATNNESNGHICRKCGALLPISTKTTRIRISTKKKEKETTIKKPLVNEEEAIQKPSIENLQNIPLNGESLKQALPKEVKTSSDISITPELEFPEDLEEFKEEKEILKEITPKPYEGSIIASKGIYGSKSEEKIREKYIDDSLIQDSASTQESSLVKQKQLEKDMTKVLKFLSTKVTVKPLEALKKQSESVEVPKSQIPPSSMNEILNNLLKLDMHIEASAIIQKGGTILASAISSRMSDSLFATIAQNLSMIGNDIIEGLNAGRLINISVKGSEGVLDLAPIDIKGKLKDDIILIIFSHPKVKSGIIHLASNIVKKQVIQYLGLNK